MNKWRVDLINLFQFLEKDGFFLRMLGANQLVYVNSNVNIFVIEETRDSYFRVVVTFGKTLDINESFDVGWILRVEEG